MNTFEARLKELLNESIDNRLGDHRPVPAFDPEHTGTPGWSAGRHRRWMLPLIAAACVVGIAVATAGVEHLLVHRGSLPAGPTSPSPSPSAKTPSPAASTSTEAPSPTPTSSPPASASVTAPAPRHVVSLGAASLSLPQAWVARDYSAYEPAGSGTLTAAQWCLTPASEPASTEPHSCPVTFGTIAPDGNPIDVDIQGGFASNPEYCPFSARGSSVEQTGDRNFGGRSADWRKWSLTCGNGKHWDLEQYVVASGPGVILFSERADATVDAAMAEITANSTLPAQTSVIRFMDRGIVCTIDRTSGGVRISLDRVVLSDSGVVNNSPVTYDYLIPIAVFDGQPNIHVGSQITLDGDGAVVKHVYEG